ncbi:hypothetical protein, partial [Stenotrophomonas sp. MYb238]|uniref:hypothetical protein n=1 Tax=Stenotrophomonas sp. MYb238 TaxID=2040281 RepID=UPI001D17300A
MVHRQGCTPPVFACEDPVPAQRPNLQVFAAAQSAGHQESISIPPKSKPPLRKQRGFGDKNPGDDLLSHGLSHTTIGA